MPQKRPSPLARVMAYHTYIFGGIVARKRKFSTYPHFAQIIHSFQGVIHIPQGKLEGRVPLGLNEKRSGELKIVGTNLRIIRKGRNKSLVHSS